MGFMTMGPLGALAGYFIGSWFDKQAVGMQEDLQADEAGRARYEQGQRNSFLFSMLVMASYVIRADRKIMHSEMEFVRRFLRANFGESAVEEGDQILLKLFDEAKRLDGVSPVAFRDMIFDCGRQIAAHLNYGERLQLLNFLVRIAQSDGNVCAEEITALREVALAMELSAGEVDSMLNLKGESLADAYKVNRAVGHGRRGAQGFPPIGSETSSRPRGDVRRRCAAGCGREIPANQQCERTYLQSERYEMINLISNIG